MVSTNIKGAMAETGERGEMAGMNCNTAVARKYTLASLLNCSRVATMSMREWVTWQKSNQVVRSRFDQVGWAAFGNTNVEEEGLFLLRK